MIRDQEESEKYLKIAQKYLLNDDQRNALKYLYKSQQAFPSSYVEGMIGKVEQLIAVSEENGRFESKRQRRDKPGDNGTNVDGDNENSPGYYGNFTRRRSSHFESPRESIFDAHDEDNIGEDGLKREFSQDQLEAVERITRCRDYYQLLGITKETSDQDLKKQYRRLALQFHPDKNSAPGASEAFKAISNAFEVLGDPVKRRFYDSNEFQRLTKSDLHDNEPYPPRYSTNHFSSHHQTMSSEDLFNVFFGNSHLYGANNQWNGPATSSRPTRGINVFFQILPVILFILMSIMSSFIIRDPVFSLIRNNKYPILRKTMDLRIPYFVKETFEKDYKHSLRELEEEVNRDYTRNLKTRCFKEKNHKENLIWKAKNIGDSTFEEQVRKMKTPSCTEYQEIQERIGT